jgi:beta-lactam-binding protein with PASTA domain
VPGELSEAYSDSVAAGDVSSQDPAPGTEVELGSAVAYTVSLGATPAVVVPDVRGLPEAEALSVLEAQGLVVGEVVQQPHERVAAGNAVKTEPAAGTETTVGSLLDLFVSSGPSVRSVPDVAGQPASDAQAALEAEGFVVTTEERTNAKVAAGNAVKTDPAAGTEIDIGGEVLLTISKGPKQVVVPDIVGLLKADARSAINDAELRPGEETVVEDAAPRNTVLSQDPAADSEVDKGTAVDYTISSGPPSAEVPPVKDLPEAEAVAALERAGLVVGSTEQKTNANVVAGNAIKTDPAAGESVEPGTAVTLTISKGPKQAAVPDVVGSVRAEAEAAIADAKLSVGVVDVVDDRSPRNTVLSQDPVAGTPMDQGSAVDLTVSSGPPDVIIPAVRGLSIADARAALEGEGLLVEVQERTNATVPAGDAVKTDPGDGTEVEVGSTVILTVSSGPKQVTVPGIIGLPEADAVSAIESAELQSGERSEANDENVARGSIISQDPGEGTVLDKDSDVDYTVSLGPVVESRGEGGSLDNDEVAGQLDEVASAVPDIRGLALGSTPYDAVSAGEQAGILAARADRLYDPATITQQEQALKRMGLLGSGDDLAALLDQLYGQALPIAYLEDRDRQSIVASIDKLDIAQRTAAAREFGQAAAYQQFGSDAARTGDPSNVDEALAAVALEEGDGTATMLLWVADNVGSGNRAKADAVIVPGDDGILASMPPLLQREYSFPFLEGRLFVDRLREDGGWDAVNAAWGRPPVSTEQILHPQLYPDDRPTTLVVDGLGGTLGKGWREQWQQTMGELRTAVWLADGEPGTQQGPRAPVKLPRANAAAGWGGDRLVSLDGPDDAWAIVWQTSWDTAGDIGQFVNAANAAIADLPGAHTVLEADISSGASNPVLVLLTSDQESLVFVAEALGLGAAIEAP